MLTVLVQAGHENQTDPNALGAVGPNGWTEIAWTPIVADAAEDWLSRHGVSTIREDAFFEGQVYSADYSLFFHFNGRRGGLFDNASVGYSESGKGGPRDAEFSEYWKQYYEGKGWSFGWDPDNYTINLTDYYGYRSVETSGAEVLIEFGTMNAIDQSAVNWLYENLGSLGVWAAEAVYSFHYGFLPSSAPALSSKGAVTDEGGSLLFEFNLDRPIDRVVQISYEINLGTAELGDFAGKTGYLEFLPNSQRAFLRVDTIPDDDLEDEEFSVTGSLVGGASTTTASAVIIDKTEPDTPTLQLPSVEISDARALEGYELIFRVDLSAKPASDVTLDVQTYLHETVDDYYGGRQTLTFEAGTTNLTRYVTVLTKPDSLVEPKEIMYVALEKVSGAVILNPADAWGAGTIIDNPDGHPAPAPEPDPPEDTEVGDHDLPSDNGSSGDPDYEMTFLSLSDSTVDYNQEFIISYGAVNNGGDAQRNQTQTGFVLSKDQRFGDNDDLYIDDDGLQNLSAGERDENDFIRVTLSDYFTPDELENRDYYIYGLLDYEMDENEQDYSDNLSDPVRITVTGVPEPVPPVATLSLQANTTIGNGSNQEGNYQWFDVVSSGPLAREVVVTWTVEGTGANPVSPEDFDGVSYPSGTVTLRQTGATTSFGVWIPDDLVAEETEGFKVSLSVSSADNVIAVVGADGRLDLEVLDGVNASNPSVDDPTDGSASIATVENVGTIGLESFTVSTNFKLDTIDGEDSILALSSQDKRNFIEVAIYDGTFRAEIGNTSDTNNIKRALGEVAIVAGKKHTVTFYREAHDDGSSTLAVFLDDVEVGRTTFDRTINLDSFDIIETGQFTWWYTGNVQRPASGTFGDVLFVAGQALEDVTVASASNIQISDIVVSSNNENPSMFDVKVTVKNTGGDSEFGEIVELFVTTTGSSTSEDRSVTTFSGPPLKTNEERVFEFEGVDLAGSLIAGDYSVYAIRHEGIIGVARSALSTFTVKPEFEKPNVDFHVPELVVVPIVGTGGSIDYDIQWSVENLSFDESPSSVQTALYLSKDEKITAEDQLLFSGPVEARIIRGEVFDFSTSYNAPGDLALGDYWFGVLADSLGERNELNELNNVQVFKFSVGEMGHMYEGLGSSGNDVFAGSVLHDVFWGYRGADDLSGGIGNDFLAGNRHNDTLNGGVGDDSIDGGEGIDLATYHMASGGVQVYLIAGRSDGADGRDSLTDIENLTGSYYDDRLIGDTSSNVLTGLSGNDLLKGKGGDDTFLGGAGNDRVFGDFGADHMEGGPGDDTLLGFSGADTLLGGIGDDRLYGGRDGDSISGGEGNDLVRGNRGNDLIDGDAGEDHLRGGGSHDTLYGGADADFIFGDNGNDTVVGGAGNDKLWGSTGSAPDGLRDVFVFRPGDGFDQIRDWEDGTDQLDLTAYNYTDFDTEVRTLAQDRPSGLRIDLGGGNVVFIDDFQRSDFDAGDVIL